ncbi:MAG: long-chain fatty acid--CoA ligase [Clostridia bacterium]|nr:long-chain fatty acid--CoA ligase [Clostridia bacterium]
MLVHQIWENYSDDLVALSYNGQTVTYGELKRNIKDVRDYYHTVGIKPGENVGLYSKNSPEFVYAYFAIVSIGAVVVPLNGGLTPNEIEYIAKDAGMKHIVTMQKLELEDKFKQLVISEYTQKLGSMDVEKSLVVSEMDDNQVAVIIYTSGTTGHPKGAMLTHKNLISNTESTIKAFRVTSVDRILCALPMFHCFAWTTIVLTALYSGATTVIMDTFNPKEALRIINSEKVTVVCGVPTMYNYYLTLGSVELFKFVRLFISGGASIPVEITDKFKTKLGITIVEGYGLSEASPVVTVNPLDDVRAGSIGVPIENVTVKIVNSEGKELPKGEIGELIVNGPNVMKGYYNLPEVTEKTIVDNWLFTGDMAYEDDEGYIYIVDRLKDVVIVSGMNVYPREIEEIIYQYEGVVEAAVIGVADKTRGEVTIAYIATKDNHIFDVQGLKNFLRENLAGFKLPKKVYLKDELPKNATGKIMKKILREEYNK